MKFISWNVNGLRACLKKGFLEFYQRERPDFCCLQETKMEQGQADVELGEGVLEYWNSAEKKGYSGTAVFTPHTPIAAAYGMDLDKHDHEGRLITLEYESFYLVCCYTPNSQDGLKRLDYRMEWEDDLREYLMSLDRSKPVIYCGDLNVAHQEIDLKNPKTNRLQRPGAGKNDRAAVLRLHRFLPPPLPGRHGSLLLVVLPFQRTEEQRRVAHRLLHRLRPPAGQDPAGGDPDGCGGQRSLPCPAGAGRLSPHGSSRWDWKEKGGFGYAQSG